MVSSIELSRERRAASKEFAVYFLVYSLGLALALFLLVLAASHDVSTAFTWLSIALSGGALVIGYAIVKGGMESASILVISADDLHQRMVAETEAIGGGGPVAINYGSTSGRLTQKPTVYRQHGDIVHIGDTVQTKQQVVVADWKDVFWLCQWFCENGLSRRKVVGKVELPFARQPVPLTLYEPVVSALVEAKWVDGRRHGAEGKLRRFGPDGKIIQPRPGQLLEVVQKQYPAGLPLQPVPQPVETAPF